MELPSRMLYLALHPHIFLLEAVVYLIYVSRLSVCYRELPLCAQGFYFQSEYIFQGRDLFCHGRSNPLTSRWLSSMDMSSWSQLRVLSVCSESSIVPEIRLRSVTLEEPEVCQRYHFMNSIG